MLRSRHLLTNTFGEVKQSTHSLVSPWGKNGTLALLLLLLFTIFLLKSKNVILHGKLGDPN